MVMQIAHPPLKSDSVVTKYYRLAAPAALAFVVIMLTHAIAPASLEAAGRTYYRNGYYSRWAAAAASARRAQTVNALQQQLAVAREMLKTAESKTAMSKSDIDDSLSRLSRIRQQAEVDHKEISESIKTLQQIEDEILSEQTPSTDFGKLEASFDESKADLDRTIRRVLAGSREPTKLTGKIGMPDVGRMTKTQQSILAADSDFVAAKEKVMSLSRQVEQAKSKLFHSDRDWISNHEALVAAKRSQRDQNNLKNSSSLHVLAGKQVIQDSQTVASTARSVIAQTETRLRQLGVSTGPSSGSNKRK